MTVRKKQTTGGKKPTGPRTATEELLQRLKMVESQPSQETALVKDSAGLDLSKPAQVLQTLYEQNSLLSGLDLKNTDDAGLCQIGGKAFRRGLEARTLGLICDLDVGRILEALSHRHHKDHGGQLDNEGVYKLYRTQSDGDTK